MDVRSANITNVSFNQPAAGMQVVMDNPRLGRAVALSDLLRQTFIVTRDHDPKNIRSRELSMIHVSKAMALHLLLGNLANNGVCVDLTFRAEGLFANTLTYQGMACPLPPMHFEY